MDVFTSIICSSRSNFVCNRPDDIFFYRECILVAFFLSDAYIFPLYMYVMHSFWCIPAYMCTLRSMYAMYSWCVYNIYSSNPCTLLCLLMSILFKVYVSHYLFHPDVRKHGSGRRGGPHALCRHEPHAR